MAKILLLEDDHDLTEMMVEWLSAERHTVEVSLDGNDGLERLRMGQYDVIVLDWGLPGLSGLDVMKTYRSEKGATPILMLTGKKTVSEKETGLDAGADDYLTKPFSMKELSARIRALLRRPAVQTSNLLEIGDLLLDPVKHRVTRNGKPIQLMPREFALLEFFMRHPDAVFSTEALLQRVCPTDSEITPDAIRTYVMRLRQKIDQDQKESLIETIPRVGYRFKLPGG